LILVNLGAWEYIVMVLYCGNLHPVDSGTGTVVRVISSYAATMMGWYGETSWAYCCGGRHRLRMLSKDKWMIPRHL